jgi:hypothetical protein
MFEAVPRIDVVVWRASNPRILLARASWLRMLPPPRESTSIWCRLPYLSLCGCHLPSAKRGRGSTHRGTTRGGATTRAGWRRDPDGDERGDDGAGGSDAGHSHTHECAAMSAISPD